MQETVCSLGRSLLISTGRHVKVKVLQDMFFQHCTAHCTVEIRGPVVLDENQVPDLYIRRQAFVHTLPSLAPVVVVDLKSICNFVKSSEAVTSLEILKEKEPNALVYYNKICYPPPPPKRYTR
jgi:hypothetical protein